MTSSSSNGKAKTNSIAEVIDRTYDATGPNKTSIRDAVASLGDASYGPLILVPALLVVTPLSGIPGLSSFFGLAIALVSVQMLTGRHHVWLPEWLLKKEVNSERLRIALDFLRRPARVIDRYTHRRMLVMMRPPLRTVLQVVCLACGVIMPFLELVPFSSSILGAAVAFFATSLVTKDGLLALVGILLLAGTASLIFYMIA